MKIVVLEPLGIAQEALEGILSSRVNEKAEIVYYPDR